MTVSAREAASVGVRAGHVTTIAATNLRRLLRDRIGLFFTFLLPLLIIVLLGAAVPGNELLIGVVDQDGTAASTALTEAVDDADGLQVRGYDTVDDLRRAVRRQRVQGGLVVPLGYGDALERGVTAEVQVVADPAAADTVAVRTRLGEVVGAQAGRLLTARLLLAEVPGLDPVEAAERAAAAVDAARADTVESTTAGSAGYQSLTTAAYAALGELVLFVFLIGLTGAGDLVETRRLGLSRRMLAAPTTSATIVVGEGAGRLAVAVAQIVAIVGLTALVFSMDWGNPLGVAAVIGPFALVATTASLLTGTLVRTPEQATSLGPVIGIAFAMLGGCMWPLEVVPEWLQTLGHLTPHAWAVDGLVAVVGEDAGPADVTRQALVLLGFALGLAPLAAWRLRRAITR